MSVFQAVQNVIDTAINENWAIIARDNKFLGLISFNMENPYSLLNPDTFGNSNHPDSIFNPNGLYGGENGIYSPFNPNSTQPPILVLISGNSTIPFSTLTVNRNLSDNLPIWETKSLIYPLLAYKMGYFQGKKENDVVIQQLKSLDHAREVNARLIESAMRGGRREY